MVTGTNGKGSVASTLSAMATAAGLKVGLFTSPHLAWPTERYRVNDQDMNWAQFNAMGSRVLAVLDKGAIEASHFEALTALGLCWFAEEQVDLQILEVGLGARQDATRAASPSHVLVTGVAMDHAELLGPTLEDIAREKLAVCAPGLCNVVSLPKSLRHLAPDCWLLGRDFRFRRTRDRLFVWAKNQRFVLPRPRLLGPHQGKNAALAAVMGLRLGLNHEAIAAGIQKVRWRARMEKIADEPPTWLDSAHNLEAVNALLKTLDELGIEDGFSLVYASHPKKDSSRILPRLAQRAGEIWCTTAPRLSPESDLLSLLKGRRGVHADASPIACLRSAQQRGKTVLVTGSIYLAGELLRQLEAEG
jgi:dihydrofolate synthase/folylpolyglutamate synthase